MNRLSPRVLSIFDLEQALDLFTVCFKNDSYYQQTYHGDEAYMKDDFRKCISWTLGQGISEGVFTEDGALVGMALLFPIDSLDPDMYEELFGDPEEDSLFSRKLKGRTGLTFMFLLGVDPSHRGKGIGSGLFDSVLRHPHLTADISSERSMRMCLDRGFDVERIKDSPSQYWWAERIL